MMNDSIKQNLIYIIGTISDMNDCCVQNTRSINNKTSYI